MRSVRCDVCGTKALMAASKCPKCGHPFAVRDGFGELLPLAHCSTCNSDYPLHLGACKWCGTQPEKSPIGPNVWKGVGIVAFLGLGVGAWLIRDVAPAGETALRPSTVDTARSATRVESPGLETPLADSSTPPPPPSQVDGPDSTRRAPPTTVVAAQPSVTDTIPAGRLAIDTVPRESGGVIAQAEPATNLGFDLSPVDSALLAIDTDPVEAPMPAVRTRPIPEAASTENPIRRAPARPPEKRAAPKRTGSRSATAGSATSKSAPATAAPTRRPSTRVARADAPRVSPPRATPRSSPRSSPRATPRAAPRAAPRSTARAAPRSIATNVTASKPPARRPTRHAWVNSVARSWVVVRADASRGSRIIASIGPDTRVQLGESRGDWRRIRAKGLAGWVYHRSFFARAPAPIKERFAAR